ncbi:MAG: precorrin-6A synthase (deacetylating) [Sneathiellales bacterium]|nr:precorrin-6A synthase (deacetylating) [Sneathiellales bacterium]
MLELFLIGIGTGNPDHLTLQAIKVMKEVDLLLIPHKGKEKDELAEIRRQMIREHTDPDGPEIREFLLPVRDPAISDYFERVQKWHEAIAGCWQNEISTALPTGIGKVALLIWGDPSLYDSSLRIASNLTLKDSLKITVVPGITSMQGLTAAHGIPINEVGESFLVTTGRLLRDKGWPEDTRTLLVMLDGEQSFQYIDKDNVHIWWGAYVGMDKEICIDGQLKDVSDEIIARRQEAKARYGWIMDIYILRKE